MFCRIRAKTRESSRKRSIKTAIFLEISGILRIGIDKLEFVRLTIQNVKITFWCIIVRQIIKCSINSECRQAVLHCSSIRIYDFHRNAIATRGKLLILHFLIEPKRRKPCFDFFDIFIRNLNSIIVIRHSIKGNTAYIICFKY